MHAVAASESLVSFTPVLANTVIAVELENLSPFCALAIILHSNFFSPLKSPG